MKREVRRHHSVGLNVVMSDPESETLFVVTIEQTRLFFEGQRSRLYTEGSVHMPFVAESFRPDFHLLVVAVLLFRVELHSITVTRINKNMFMK
jgi:hypothetical protein